MKRAPLVVGATATGLAGVLMFHTHTPALVLAGQPAVPVAAAKGSSSTTTTAQRSTTSTGATSTTTPASTSTTSPRTATTSPSTTTSRPATTTTSPPATTAPSTTTTSPSGTRTVTGPSVDYSYGVLSVSVTESGGQITQVTIGSLNDGGNFRSQSIDEQSIPILEQEALSAQSANIQAVSGATYTSEGFAQSLQSALTTLGK